MFIGVLSINQTKGGRECQIAQLTEPKFFGELSILDKQTITATVVVHSDTCIMQIVEKQVSSTLS